MKRIVSLILSVFIAFQLFAVDSDAAEIDQDDLEKVTLTLLHPTIVEALKKHYGGFTQFENVELVKVVSRQSPADLKEDSAFKSPASIYDLTLQLDALKDGVKKEMITMILSNEFATSGFEVLTIDVN